MRARWRPTLLTRFAVTSLVAMVVVGLVVAQELGSMVRRRTLDDAIRTAEVAVNLGVKPLLKPADLQRDFVPLDDERFTELDDVLSTSLSTNGVVRIKVWNRQHWLVYTDKGELRGRWFPGNELLDDAFEGGVVSEITDLTAPEELEDRDFGRLLAVYVPLRADGTRFSSGDDGEVIGAFEIYLPYQPIAAAIDTDTNRLLLALGLGLAVLWLALWRLVAVASRRLRLQSRDNEHQATHDQLTDLANRRLMHQRAETSMANARRAGTRMAVAICDIDRFKEINDVLGHRAGDYLLREVGERLAHRVRPGDTVARLGGDEFAIVLGEVTAMADVMAAMEELRAELERPFTVVGLDLDVRASFGVAVFPDHGEEVDDLTRHADVAMYAAKRTHAGCVVYNPGIDQFSLERLELAAEVRRALEQHEFVVLYQPKVDLITGRAVGAEALVRWQHPQRGLLGPGDFIDLVENSEHIGPLTLYVVEQALVEVARWTAAGIDMKVAVNLSARNAADLTLPRRVQELLGEHGVPPERLELELTESALLDDPERAKSVLTALDGLGVSLSVDDFGTGYASLSYLTELPVSVVKIDQSFVRNILTDDHAAAVVRFSCELGRTLGMDVVAEGIEDIDTAEAVAAMGVHIGQGYLFAKPMNADLIPAWVRQLQARTDAAARTTESEPAEVRREMTAS